MPMKHLIRTIESNFFFSKYLASITKFHDTYYKYSPFYNYKRKRVHDGLGMQRPISRIILHRQKSLVTAIKMYQ